jgi:hypothetical protein
MAGGDERARKHKHTPISPFRPLLQPPPPLSPFGGVEKAKKRRPAREIFDFRLGAAVPVRWRERKLPNRKSSSGRSEKPDIENRKSPQASRSA